MNGYAPVDLSSRYNYIGLHNATGFDSNGWLAVHSGIRKVVPADILTDESLVRRLLGFYADLEKALQEIWRVLRPEGHAVIVMGDNVIKGQRVASHRVVVQLAKAIGFEKRVASQREIATLRRRYPVGPFGFDGPMTHEFVLVLKKPREKSRTKKRRTHGGTR